MLPRLKPDAGWGVLAAIQRLATTLASGWLITREFAPWLLPGTRFHSSNMSSVNPVFVGKEVDLEQRRSNIIMKKTRQTLEAPLKRYSGPVLEARQGAKHGRSETGVEERGETGRAFRHHLAYLPHTSTSRLTSNGADLVNVKELLGHFERRSEAPGVG
jgi:hypothetical protein